MIWYKAIKLFSVLIIISLLTSCASEKNKEAYCFSMVFEKENNTAKVTLYCKTPDNEADNGKMKSTIIDATGKDFKTAIKKVENKEFEIYFNSIMAFYLSKKLSTDEVSEIADILLDNTKYKTDNYIYSANISSSNSISKYHNEAEKVCSNEGIGKDSKGDYTPTLKKLRELIIKQKKMRKHLND